MHTFSFQQNGWSRVINISVAHAYMYNFKLATDDDYACTLVTCYPK